MFVRTFRHSFALAMAFGFLALSGAAKAATDIEGVRFGRHDTYVRIVVDSKAPLSFDYANDSYPFVLLMKDARGAAVDQAFSDSYDPLHHLILETTEDGNAKLTVTATAELTPRFLQLDKDDRGLYRLVIDLTETDEFDHLAIGQKGLNSSRVRVQFGDSLSAGH